MPEAERVRAGLDCPYRPLLHPHGVGDRAHLERIRHHQPVVAELLAEEPVQDLSAHRRRGLAEPSDDDVRGHDRLDPGLDRRAKGHESFVLDGFDHRELVMGVLGRIPVPRKVLRTSHDACALQTANERGDVPATSGPSAPNERMPMTGFCGFVFTSATGARSRFTPTARRSAAIAARDLLRELDVVNGSESRVARVRAPGPRLQPGHIAAFLVDPDEDVVPLGTQCRCQQSQLLRALDVPPEEDDAAQTLVRASAEPSRAAGPSNPGKMQASRAARALASLIP